MPADDRVARAQPAAEVAPGVWIIPIPLGDSPYGPEYTNCIVFVDEAGRGHVVDPGDATDAGYALLAAGIGAIGLGFADLVTITATHLHRDHLGLAARLRAESGARLVLHRREQQTLDGTDSPASPRDLIEAWGVPADHRPELEASLSRSRADGEVRADILVDDGEELPTEGRRIEILHTPGHTAGHLCLFDHSSRTLCTGDLLLPDIYPGIGLGGSMDDALGAYRSSVQRVAELPAALTVPGHGRPFTAVGERATATLAHHRRRTEEVAAGLAENPGATVWELAQRATWTLGWDALRGSALRSALAQIAMHAEHVRGAS